MNLQITNKTVLVSGSTTGIGYAIANAFAKEGARVFINGRNPERVNEAIAKIRLETPGADLNGIVADLATAEGVASVVKQLPQVDILVNNIGIYGPVSFFESTDEDWLNIFNVNVLSGVRLTQAYMPAMLSSNWGRVIFISSESSIQVPTEMIHYGMTKTAQLSIANGLAQLTKGTGVTVNSILPGPTFSDGVEKFIGDLATQKNSTVTAVEEDFFKETRPLSLLQRFITTDEVASAVVYVSSPLAAATNGAAIRVDGGILKGIH